MIGHNSSVFRFSDVEVHERELHIRRNGDVVPVEPKAFRVLVHLLRNPGRLVAKEELIRAGWGDTAVTDNSLTRNIALLRRLLGDDPREPRYIETVSTVGYRFVCPVEVEAGAVRVAVESAGSPVGNTQHVTRRWTIRIWLPLGAALVLLVAISAWYLLGPLPPLGVVSFRQITFDGGDKELAGTDGIKIYFNRDHNLRRSVFSVLAAGGDVSELPIQIPNEMWVEGVSPDGANLLIYTDEYGVSPVHPYWIVRTTDGVPVRRLPDAIAAGFSADAKSVIYCTADGNIWSVGSDGTGAHKIAAAGGVCDGAGWSPDRARILFNRDGRLWEMSSTGSNLHPLLPDGIDPPSQGGGQWTVDGRFFVFNGSGKGSSRGDIWALDERQGFFHHRRQLPIQLTGPPIYWDMPVRGKEGDTFFAIGEMPRGELSRFDSKTRQFQPFLGGISAQGSNFTRDGRSVAYVSYPEGFLFKASHDGSNAVQITDGNIAVYEPTWSPDGTRIAFMNLPSDRVGLYVVSAAGGVPQRLLPDDPDEEFDTAWSPDGKEIAFYVRPKEWSKSHIRIVDLATRQVPDLPGSMGMVIPRWSPDGRFIAATTYEGFNEKLFDLRSQKWISLLEKTYVGFPRWSHDSHWLYYWSTDSADTEGIYRVRIPGGKPELVVSLKGMHRGGWFNAWMGLDAGDAPLIMREIGRSEIYALTLERR